MKKNLLIFLGIYFFTALTVNAQINKGGIFLGGNLSASFDKTTGDDLYDTKSNVISITPAFGKAIKQNLVVGADITASFSRYKNEGGSSVDQRQDAYGLGAFIRKYKQIGKSDFAFFVQGRAGFSYGKTNNKNISGPASSDISKRYSIGINIYPGLSYNIGKRFQLETGLSDLVGAGYYTQRRKISDQPYFANIKSNGFNIYTSLSSNNWFYIGFRVMLNKA